MRNLIWVLPLILLVSVVVLAYFLGLAQDRASKNASNMIGYIDKGKLSENINIHNRPVSENYSISKLDQTSPK